MGVKHIFIVDDEILLLRAIEVSLELNGYKVSTANNGKQAIERINEIYESSNELDLLITDIQMPQMNGVEMIQELNKKDRKIPVMAITGFGTKEMVIELLRLGVKDYIDKPFEPEELANRIEKFLIKQENSETTSEKKSTSKVKSNHQFEVKEETALLTISQNGPLEQEALRSMLLELLAFDKPKICIDLNQVLEIDITFINGLIGLHNSHREKYSSGELDLINVDKNLSIIFKSIELDNLYTISHKKD